MIEKAGPRSLRCCIFLGFRVRADFAFLLAPFFGVFPCVFGGGVLLFVFELLLMWFVGCFGGIFGLGFGWCFEWGFEWCFEMNFEQNLGQNFALVFEK